MNRLRRMLLVLFALTASPSVIAGSSVPVIRFWDDSGRSRLLSEFSGRPLLIVPMYTKCRASCSNLVSGVTQALAQSKVDPTSYIVLLFSFDSRDGSKDLREFRNKLKVPLAWKLGAAEASSSRALMDAIGFRYASAGGEFSHGNMVAVLDGDMKLAKSVYGTRFLAGQLDNAIGAARGGRDWGDWYKYAFPLFLFGFSLSGVYLFHLLKHRP